MTSPDISVFPPSLLSRIVRVTKDVVEYREWVEQNWGEPALVSFIPQPLPDIPKVQPTYASIANRFTQNQTMNNPAQNGRKYFIDVSKTGMRPLPRSQSNLGSIVTQYDGLDPFMPRPSSSDSLVALSSGLTVDLDSDFRLSNYKGSMSANSPTAAPPKKSKENTTSLDFAEVTASSKQVCNSPSHKGVSYSGAIKSAPSSNMNTLLQKSETASKNSNAEKNMDHKGHFLNSTSSNPKEEVKNKTVPMVSVLLS